MSEQDSLSIRVPYNYFTPRWYQIEVFKALESGKRRLLLNWARQLGKDTTCFCAMVMAAMKRPGNYFYIFPTREAARRAVWEKIDHDGKELLSVIPQQILLRKSDQEMMIRINSIGGISTIRFIGLDYNPDAIRGITPAGVILSEFAYQDPEAFFALSPALRQHKDAWVIFNSTPQGKNHFYDMYINNLDNPGWFVSTRQIMFPEKDSYVKGIKTVEELRSIQSEEGRSDEAMAQEYGCSFDIGALGSIYSDLIEKARKEKRVTQFLPDDTLWVDTFWDIGYNDPTAIWFRQCAGNAEIFIDYWEGNGRDIPSMVQVLESKGYKFRTHYLPHDASHNKPGMVVTFQELLEETLRASSLKSPGSTIVCPKVPVQDGINGVRARFSRFCFNEGLCRDGLRALDNYHRRYDPKYKVFTKEPVHDQNSHAADALRTCVSAEDMDLGKDLRYNVLTTGLDYDILS